MIMWSFFSQLVASLFSMRKRCHPGSRLSLCVQTPGSDLSRALCRKKACLCSTCLEQSQPIFSSSDGFEDDCPPPPAMSSSCVPTGKRKAIKNLARKCLNCVTGYSADCLAVCCCPLSIPQFLFITLPVLLYRRLRLRVKGKKVSPYQRLGINPDELRKPKASLLKDEDMPFAGFGGEHWNENFE